MNTNTNKEAKLINRYGEEKILRHDRHGWRVKRTELTSIIKLNQFVGKAVGEKIKVERLKKGFTMTFLGQLCGLPDPKGRIWAIENNTRKEGIRFGTLYLIAIALEIEVAALLPTTEELTALATITKFPIATLQVEGMLLQQ